MPTAATIRRIVAPLAVTTAALALVFLVSGGPDLAALQKMAGYEKGDSLFGSIETYLRSLRDSLIPLTIPLGAIGITAGAAAYMVGNVMAQRILGGVILGLALALMGPSLVA